ncbi:hypothetical protein B0T22DRAFT_297796 [Podospora appendiculata]|uniref:Zn(2)-C6 fungal-type domain-containing protein n=1 Tax=Podospora appendiculata TaxID=314037 RepID=A0AAE0X211_9PEZI|nr:hypothetical protein B0T22DRAFT_297796 [Podospora appendiculata]
MSEAQRAEAERRRKVRKGTHSCWECRRRKIRCQYGPASDTVCLPCQARGSACRSQEFVDESRPQQAPDRRMAQRLGRLEDLMARLVDRILPDASPSGKPRPSYSHSHSHSPGRSDRASPTPSQDTVADGGAGYNNHALDVLEASVGEETPVGLLLGLRNIGSTSHQSAQTAMLTPESDKTDSTSPAASNPPRYDKTCRALHALFPSQNDVDVITGSSAGPFFLVSLFFAFRDLMQGTAPPASRISVIPPITCHPTVLARQLLQLCICMQQLPPGFDTQKLQKQSTTQAYMASVVTSVTSLVTSNDDLIGTAEGLESLVLQGLWHSNAGNLRKAWLSYRRALSLGQLMGIDAGSSRGLKHVDPSTSPEQRSTPENLWFRINCFERFSSLLLGLPAGSPDNSFATEDAMKRNTQMERLERIHTVIAGRMIERNANKTNQAYAITQSIDCDLGDAATKMGHEWWTQEELDPSEGSEQKLGQMLRLMMQVHHFDLLILLHLPYMLRGPSETRYDYSKATCTRSSREVLRRFIPFRMMINSAWSCRHIDYSALVAAMTLLLSYLRQHEAPSEPTPSCAQRAEDRKLVELVRERMQHVALLNQDKLSKESANVLGQMMPILDSIDISLAGGISEYNGNALKRLHLDIPYLGTINIHPSMTIPAVNLCPSEKMTDDLHGDALSVQAESAAMMLQQLQTPVTVEATMQMSGGNAAAAAGGLAGGDTMHMDFGSLDPALLPPDVSVNGMFMQFEPQPQDGELEFPDLMAEANDWVFQGVDTTYWSLLNGNTMGWGG